MPIAVTQIQDIAEDPSNPGNPILYVQVFMGQPGSAKKVLVSVPFLLSDTAAVIAGKVTTAIVTAAAPFGFTLARTDVLLPSFVRGS